MSQFVVGIDLGTTYSVVAVMINGTLEVIPNEQGELITPSYVAFSDQERLIGDAAKSQLASNSANTVFDVKRLIGRKFNDPIVQEDIKQWPFNVIENNGMPRIEVTYKNERKLFSPEEISAMILENMKGVAESYLNSTVKNVVITVPAYFNDLQLAATRDAAKIAGLNVIRFISEPNAAALAYGINADTNISKNILVYDLGGGTFDCSILHFQKGNLTVKAVGGNTHLGGEDFNNRLMEVFVEDFKSKHNLDISNNKKALRRLRTECEKVKCILSSTSHASVEIDALCNEIDFDEKISRAKFEDICSELFQSTITTVQKVLVDAKLRCDDISTVVLVGGSTRIPKIQFLLKEMFKGKEICIKLHPGLAVATGAAITASMINKDADSKMKIMELQDVTPLTLGVASGNNVQCMSPLIERNTPIPVSKHNIFTTTTDKQTTIVLQGERYLAKDNLEIGRLDLNNIPPALAKMEQVIVTFHIDINGILSVKVVSKSNSDLRSELSIKNVRGSLSQSEIDQMIANAITYRKEDQEQKKYFTARSDLELYAFTLRNQYGLETAVHKKCIEVIEWLNESIWPDETQFLQKRKSLDDLRKENDDNEPEAKRLSLGD